LNKDKLKKLIVPSLPYLLVFWFSNKLCEAYRVSQGSNMLKKLTDTVSNLNTILLQPLPSFHLFDFCIGLIGAAAIYMFVYYKKKHAKKWRKDVEYGSARWGGKKDIEPYTDPKPENNIILTATESLTLNSRPKNPKYARNKNVLIVGGSGSGKTRFFVKPNIMQCESRDYPTSFVITDPKGLIS
jgi:type IV secretion system protein VirD4